MSNKFILITGCSGGGKTTLVDVLGARGYATVSEPGRRIVAEETSGTGCALPWVDMKAFAHRALAMAHSDLVTAGYENGFVFFDRGLVDAAVALQFAGGEPFLRMLDGKRHYSAKVFLAPPWPEIFMQDDERRHNLESATEEYRRIEAALLALGYEICSLPKAPVDDRADFVQNKLGSL